MFSARSHNPGGIPELKILNPKSRDWENQSGTGIPIDNNNNNDRLTAFDPGQPG